VLLDSPAASRRCAWLTRTLNVCFLEFLRSVSAILSFRFGSAAPKQPHTEMFVIGDRHRQGSVRCGHSALHSIVAIDTQASAYEEYGFPLCGLVAASGTAALLPVELRLWLEWTSPQPVHECGGRNAGEPALRLWSERSNVWR
jgi:hypothetical protein